MPSGAVQAVEDHAGVQIEQLDYAGVLNRLMGLLGKDVLVGVGGADRTPPMVVNFDGVLSKGFDGPAVFHHPDAVTLMVGDVSVKLHPDQFVEASVATNGPVPGRQDLHLRFGNLVVSVAGPAPTG